MRLRLSPAERALLALSLAGALLHGAAAALALPAAVDLAAKAVTVPPLALVAAGRRRSVAGAALLAAALAVHAAGDMLIERTLLAGVAAFLVGHLCYIRLFWRARRATDAWGGATKLALGLLALFAAAFLSVVAPRLDGHARWAIPLYGAALTIMAGGALLSRRGRPWVPAGGLAYVASDALLALELFARGAGPGRHLVWPLYVGAQWSIALGWVLGRTEPELAANESSAEAGSASSVPEPTARVRESDA